MRTIKNQYKRFLALLMMAVMLFSVPLISNADSEGSIEIKMDLSYKYKRDDFRVIYKDASGKEYDVTSKSELEIEEIDTGVTTGGGDGIVRKAVATYNGLSDTVYEYTMWYKEGSKFSDLLGTGVEKEVNGETKLVRIEGEMDAVSRYLIQHGGGRPIDILNVKIKNNTYKGESENYIWFSGKNATNDILREVNLVGCNGDDSDYDMPIFDGEGKKSKFIAIRLLNSAARNDNRRINLHNFKIQNYWNGLFYRSHKNGLIKGLVFMNIETPPGASPNPEIADADHSSCAALSLTNVQNTLVEDVEFRNIFGSASTHRAIYPAHNTSYNLFTNNFFINTNCGGIGFRDESNNNKVIRNYWFDAGVGGKDGKGVGYAQTNQQKDPKDPSKDEKESVNNEFCGNKIRLSEDNPHRAVTIKPYAGTMVGAYYFEPCSDCTNGVIIKDYSYHYGIDIPDMDERIKINSCDELNTSEISTEPYVPVRSIIRHVDKDGKALRANDVIVTNGGETFTAQAKADLIGADGNSIYTKDYVARLYDESGKEVTKDVEGKSIVDADGYIKTDGSGALLRSLKNDNQTFTFIYAPSARLTINHTGDTIDYSSITDIKELEKHIPVDVSSDTPAPAAAVETLMLKTESEDDVKGSSYLPLKFQSRKQKTNAVTLKWSKVSGAEQYVIYGNLCNTKGKKYKMVKIATLKGSKKSYTVKKIEGKKLKKGTYYKFVIVAQKDDKVTAAAKTIHVATTGNKKKSNYTGVSVDKKIIAKAKKLKKGASLSLKAKPSLKKGSKAQSHVAIRYESSNRMIATVSKNGKIRARGRGMCYIYAYTQSGITKKIKVEVV